eukprot:GGOE01020970.1.p1 GENE.GGOE01020970.1~~GGOE01020970.1.p1  ORF type:complete len:1054 (-),score=230.20 GGOE01020970.1:108-3023(-)
MTESDFALLTVAAGCQQALFQAWESHPTVKGVFPHQQIHRGHIQTDDLDVGGDPGCTSEAAAPARRTLKMAPFDVVRNLRVANVWQRGTRGRNVKVAVFDTGIAQGHRHFHGKGVVKICINYTNGPVCEDGHGHGTFVAGVIASSAECLGIVPDAELHIFKVFTDRQVSYTSWFLDAFNHAIENEVDVVNFSIGGPDYLDKPFLYKVWEASASGIAIVSAIGNDGPFYGTLSNPADMMDVIGVGAVTQSRRIAWFSSRGMTTWELPSGCGRFKPDIVTFGEAVSGSNRRGGCKALSGTSVASPVVAGATALMVALAKQHRRPHNVAMLKQVLTATARRLPEANIFEQGAGLMDLEGAAAMAVRYVPHVSLLPAALNLTDCPYLWPYCSQPVFHTAAPLRFNLTILNGLGVTGRVVRPPEWVVTKGPDALDVRTSYSEVLWPWSGFLAIEISVADSASDFQGTVEGKLLLVVESPLNQYTAGPSGTGILEEGVEYRGRTVAANSTQDASACRMLCRGHPHCTHWTFHHPTHWCYCRADTRAVRTNNFTSGPNAPDGTAVGQAVLPIVVPIAPRPPRVKRILWDQFHSLQYPPGYIPRDNLAVQNDLLDWNGDHPHTNFREMYLALRKNGYHLDVLGSDYLDFDASLYGVLLVVDPEEEFFRQEVSKLEDDIRSKGLALVVFADWYDKETIESVGFFDDNTHSWWHAAVGGANLPALNDLLAPFNVSLGGAVLDGEVSLPGSRPFPFGSGASLRQFPSGGRLWTVPLDHRAPRGKPARGRKSAAILGVTDPAAGRVAIFGDSSCLDAAHNSRWCFDVLLSLLRYSEGLEDDALLGSLPALQEPFIDPDNPAPQRTNSAEWAAISTVMALGRNHTAALHHSRGGLRKGHEGRQASPAAAQGTSNAHFANRPTVRHFLPDPMLGQHRPAPQHLLLFAMPISSAALVVFLTCRRRRRLQHLKAAARERTLHSSHPV